MRYARVGVGFAARAQSIVARWCGRPTYCALHPARGRTQPALPVLSVPDLTRVSRPVGRRRVMTLPANSVSQQEGSVARPSYIRRMHILTSPIVNFGRGARRALLPAAMCVSGLASAQARPPMLDVPYVSAGEPMQRLDFYLPDARRFPTLIVVHGGGLTSEDKRDTSLPAVCQAIANAGIGCASINYRLGPMSKWPAQPDDVAAAVALVQRNVNAYGGDSAAVVLLGHSSGCHLASLVGTDVRYLATQRLTTGALRGVVAMGCTLAPVLPAIADSGRLRAVFERGALSTFGSIEAFTAANPTAYVSEQTPPFLVLIAETEQENPPILEHARKFEARMIAAKRPIAIHVLPNRRHYTALSSMANKDDPTLDLVLDFVRRVTGRSVDGRRDYHY